MCLCLCNEYIHAHITMNSTYQWRFNSIQRWTIQWKNREPYHIQSIVPSQETFCAINWIKYLQTTVPRLLSWANSCSCGFMVNGTWKLTAYPITSRIWIKGYSILASSINSSAHHHELKVNRRYSLFLQQHLKLTQQEHYYCYHQYWMTSEKLNPLLPPEVLTETIAGALLVATR